MSTGEGKMRLYLWNIVMGSIVPLCLLVWALLSIGDLQMAERELGRKLQTISQYEDTVKPYDPNKREEMLDELQPWLFVAGMQDLKLEAKLVVSCILIFAQTISLARMSKKLSRNTNC